MSHDRLYMYLFHNLYMLMFIYIFNIYIYICIYIYVHGRHFLGGGSFLRSCVGCCFFKTRKRFEFKFWVHLPIILVMVGGGPPPQRINPP